MTKHLLASAFAILLAAPLAAQTPPSTTTVAVPISVNDSQVFVASSSGMAPGQVFYVDRETMRVAAVQGLTIAVYRGLNGSNPQAHNAGATVYYGRGDQFLSNELSGACSVGSSLVFLRPSTGDTFGCISSNWTKLNGGGGAANAAAIVTALAADTTQKIACANLAAGCSSLPTTGGPGNVSLDVTNCAIPTFYFGATSPCAPGVSISASPSTQTSTLSSTASVTAAFTITATGVSLSAPITLAASGLPAGSSIAFSPATIGSTGGTSTATVTLPSNTATGAATITFTGTSTSYTGTATATLTVNAPSNFLTKNNGGSVLNLTSTYAIPTGSLDWKVDNASPNEKKSGSAYLADLAVYNQGGCSDPQLYAASGGVALSWTNGTTSASGSSAAGYLPGGNCQIQQNLPLTDTSAHTYNGFYYAAGGDGSAAVTTTISLSDGSSTAATFVDTTAGASVSRKFSFTVRASAASSGSPVTVYVRQFGAGLGGYAYKGAELVN